MTHGHNKGQMIRIRDRYEHWERKEADGRVTHHLYNLDTRRWMTATLVPA